MERIADTSLIMIGNDTTRITRAAFDSMPSPIHRINNGAREIFGAVWIMMTNGMIRRSINRIFAIIYPRISPITIPITVPIRISSIVTRICFMISPLTNSFTIESASSAGPGSR